MVVGAAASREAPMTWGQHLPHPNDRMRIGLLRELVSRLLVEIVELYFACWRPGGHQAACQRADKGGQQLQKLLKSGSQPTSRRVKP